MLTMQRRATIRHPLAIALALCVLVQAALIGFGLAGKSSPMADPRLIPHSERGAVLLGSGRVSHASTVGQAGRGTLSLAAKFSSARPQLRGSIFANEESATFRRIPAGLARLGRAPPYFTL
jgi:hypothetical protein